MRCHYLRVKTLTKKRIVKTLNNFLYSYSILTWNIHSLCQKVYATENNADVTEYTGGVVCGVYCVCC